MEQQKTETSRKDFLDFPARGQELHEIKNRLQAAVDATGGAIYEHRVPLDGTAYHDDRWAEIIGYNSNELPQYDNFVEWLIEQVHPEDKSRVEQAYSDFVEGKRPNYRIEFRLRHKEGHWVWVEAYAHAVERDKTGRATRIVGMMRDITDRKRVEQELNQLNARLEQEISERTALAEERAKQLQSLAVELVEAEERERSSIAELLHDDLQQILASAHLRLQSADPNETNAATIEKVDELLKESIAKTRQLSHELSPAILNNSDLPDALRWLLRHMGEHFGLEVELESDSCGPLPESLKRFLFRAAQEFLFNTIKHADVKTAKIAVTQSDKYLSLTVSDHGCGFEPEALDNKAKPPGLGVMTIRERASYMGGSLDIQAAPGRGSCFTLTIPCQLTESRSSRAVDQPAETGTSMAKNDAAVVAQTDKKVLFVDDHGVMRQGLIELIADQSGIQVVGEAENGLQAIEQARELQPDVIVMDISMPVMDGIEATRLIKAEMPHTRVIGLSMFDDEHIVSKLRQAGAEAYINKSASSAELLRGIYGSGHQL
ncbi:MAG: response regulator [Desulfosalsimonadaceae bacterium]